MAHLSLQSGTYDAADALLGSRDSRKVGHNTRLERLSDGTIGVRYHATIIYRMRSDGWAVVSTGGWDTVTTWQRVNALLPAPWAVHSSKGRRMLYSAGRPITPFADGLAVHLATGAVGFAETLSKAPGVILSPEDVATVRAAADAAKAARDAKRAARLAREHPEPRDMAPYASVTSWSIPSPHRGRPWDCPSCNAEHEAHRPLYLAALTAAHDAGEHVTQQARHEWPKGPDGRTDYTAEPTRYTVTVPACPWECPRNDRRF